MSGRMSIFDLEAADITTSAKFRQILLRAKVMSGLSCRHLASKLGVSHGYVSKLTSNNPKIDDFLPSDKYCVKRFLEICGIQDPEKRIIMEAWETLREPRIRATGRAR